MIFLTDFTDFMDFRLPNHIAIIPDGNRRWAKAKGLPGFMGHREGAKTTEKILSEAVKLGVPYLTFWGASVSNLEKRDSKEVRFLIKLFTAYFKRIAKAKLIHQKQVNIQVLGRWRDYFPKEAQVAIRGAVEATKKYSAFHLTILLAYSGTEEMLVAVNEIISSVGVGARHALPLQQVDAVTLKSHLYTKNLPPVDLVIRTGNEPHLSTGFMMWDTAEAQLYFSKNMWPDFTTDEMLLALQNFAKMQRRMGK